MPTTTISTVISITEFETFANKYKYKSVVMYILH